MSFFTFDKSTYLSHVFYIPAAVVLVSVLANMFAFRELWLLRMQREKRKRQLLLLAMILSVGVGLLYPVFQTLRFGIFLPLEQPTDIISREGVVESVEACRYSPRYYLDDTGNISRPYLVTIDGNQYFCAAGDLLKQGDHVSFSCYAMSRMIVSCQRLDQNQTGESGLRGASFDHWAALLSLAFLGASALLGYYLASVKFRSMNEENSTTLRGDFLFENGLGAIIFTIIGLNTAWLLIPFVRHLKFGIYILPYVAIVLIRQIPINYEIGERRVDVMLFGWLRVRSYDLSAVDRVVCGSGTFGGAMILMKPDADEKICRSIRTLFIYRVMHWRQLIFLPIKTADEAYARELFSEKLGMEVKYIIW